MDPLDDPLDDFDLTYVDPLAYIGRDRLLGELILYPQLRTERAMGLEASLGLPIVNVARVQGEEHAHAYAWWCRLQRPSGLLEPMPRELVPRPGGTFDIGDPIPDLVHWLYARAWAFRTRS